LHARERERAPLHARARIEKAVAMRAHKRYSAAYIARMRAIAREIETLYTSASDTTKAHITQVQPWYMDT